MDRHLGVWIDHKQAFLIKQEDRKVEVILSDVEPRIHFSGGIRIGGRYNQSVDSELRHNDRYNQHLSKYYNKVIKFIQNADSIFIMGPGEAKFELKKEIQKHKSLFNKISRIESADKMTKNQMVAHVKNFYQKQAAT